MAKLDVVTVKVTKWADHNPRGDVKKPSWFRLEYSLIEDPDFYDFSHEEFKVWIYVLAQACKKNSAEVRLNYAHANATAKLSKRAIDSALEKLQQLQIVHMDVTPTLRMRDVDVTYANATERNGTDGTEQTERNGAGPPRTSRLPEIAEIWNQKADSRLARVREMTPKSPRNKACTERWREKPDRDYWAQAIDKINASAFCLGAKGWKADIEFLTRPDSAAKLLEGKYDSVGPEPTPKPDPNAGLSHESIEAFDNIERMIREREEAKWA